MELSAPLQCIYYGFPNQLFTTVLGVLELVVLDVWLLGRSVLKPN